MTLTHVNGFFDTFGINSTNKVRYQKTLYYASSNNLCFCTIWQNAKHKMAFFTCCISALSEFNWLLLDFFSLFDSRLILTTHTIPIGSCVS